MAVQKKIIQNIHRSAGSDFFANFTPYSLTYLFTLIKTSKNEEAAIYFTHVRSDWLHLRSAE
jgi:hypothetical protein